MSYDPAFDEFMIHTVTVTPVTARDGAGAATYGSPVLVRGRVEHDMKLVRDDKGREVVSQTALYLKPTDVNGNPVAIGKADQITLPAGFVPSTPPLISVQPHYDEVGLHHLEVRL